jgi:hypothetical protein
MLKRCSPGFAAAAVAAVLACLAASFGLASAQQPASIAVDPPSQSVAVGESFDVRVQVDDVQAPQGLGGYTLALNYDPSVVHARTITDSGFVASTGNSTICPATGIDNDAGQLAHFCFTLPILAEPGPQTSEPVTLVTVRFEAVAAGTSALDIGQTTIMDLQGAGIDATTANGQVIVGAGGEGPADGGQAGPDAGGTAEPAEDGTEGTLLPRSGDGGGGGSQPIALYVGLIVAGAAALLGLAAFSLVRTRRGSS